MRKLRRRVRRLGRRKQTRWVLVAGLFVLVLMGGLLSAGFLNSPVDSGPDGSAGGAAPARGGALSSVPATPSTSASVAPRSARKAEYPTEIPASARALLPNNPLNSLDLSDVHTVVLSATSRSDIGIGYLVPTGLSDNYGKARVSGGSWSLGQKALGPGYLAIVFIQADAKGTPLTCRITVDGKVTSTETVSAPYARTVCLG